SSILLSKLIGFLTYVNFLTHPTFLLFPFFPSLLPLLPPPTALEPLCLLARLPTATTSTTS
ncbi:unnamed protein product, partial [Sphagnum compactum]